MYSPDGTQLQTGEKFSFTITPPLIPSLDQIFARIAVSRMECYNAMYNIPSALSFEYTIKTLATNAEQSYTITMAAGQYAASDVLSALFTSLDTRLTFTYDSKAYKFTLAVANSDLSSLALGTAAAAWAYLYLKFSITTDGEYVSRYTSESIATLVPTENIYIAIDAFQCSSAIRVSKQTYPNIVARVPMVAAPVARTSTPLPTRSLSTYAAPRFPRLL
jgi:hypothetical protein